MARICRCCLILLSIMIITNVKLAMADGTWEVVETRESVDSLLRFRDVFFIDPDNGWGADISQMESHHIVRTTDGGRTWKTQFTMPWWSPYDVFFLDAQRGWVTGDGGSILHTEDGGRNWQERNLSSGEQVRSIYFIDANRGWIAATSASGILAVILHTEDGGVTWIRQYEAQLGFTLTEVYFINADEGWVLGWSEGLILHTEDGGNTWEEQESGVEGSIPLYEIDFASEDVGWIRAYDGIILHTRDGGETWVRQDSGTDELLGSIHVIDENEVWVTGTDGILLHTEDGGMTWHKIDGPFEEHSLNIQFFNADEGCITSQMGGIYHTSDGGITWEMTRAHYNYSKRGIGPFRVHFVNESTGWLIGGKGLLLHTSDSGETWEFQRDITNEVLRDIFFLDERQGWIVGYDGNDGIILHTTDGGAEWEYQRVDMGMLFGVNFSSSEEGCVAGRNGIFYTDNGGRTWENATPGNVPGIQSWSWSELDFVDSKHGWALCPSMDRVAYTDDGGDSWAVIRNSNIPLSELDFVNEREGWGVGSRIIWDVDGETLVRVDGYAFHTKDGGKAWEQVLRVEHSLDHLCFVSATEGWVISEGQPGIILHTSDGGETWEEQNRNEARRLSDICYDGKNSLYSIFSGSSMYTVHSNPNIHILAPMLRYTDPDLSRIFGPSDKLITTWGKVRSQLFQNYPNPFNPDTWIPYQLAAYGKVTITIYDTVGHVVRTLALSPREAGLYITKDKAAYWDGKNDKGEKAASGLYFYKLETSDFSDTKKMVLAQ